jgi:CRP-like cAMP-binding protein
MAKASGAQAQDLSDLFLKPPGQPAEADWTGVLGEVPIFADLSARQLRRLAKIAKIKRVEPFTQIVLEGESADAFFLILDGNAVVRPPGKRLVKLGMGDFFGELALLDDSPRSATVEAQNEVLLARISRKDFLRLLDKEPKVSLVLLRTLAARLRSSERSHKH